MIELRKMIDTRVTPQELTLAKDAITLQLPALFETNDRTVGSLSTLFTHGLPLNYYSNLAEQISVVDAQAVQEVAKKYLVPEKFVVVAVGDRSEIGEALQKELGDDRGNSRPRRSARQIGVDQDPRYNSGPFTVLFQWASRQQTAGRGGRIPCST